MKIDIGPYSSDLIPISSWERRYEMWRSGKFYHNEEDWNWFDEIVYKIFEKLEKLALPINRWSYNRERKVKIRIDSYDVWNADHTLALVIHPVLVKLKQVQHGSGFVDLDDVPEHLRPTEEAGPSNGYTDNTIHARWAWVLDEMIWTFEQLSKDDKGENQFSHNVEQLELNLEEDNSVSFNYQKNPAKPKYWVDTEAKKLHNDRIENGLRLFAKYYLNLWD